MKVQFSQKTREKDIKIFSINDSIRDQSWINVDRLRLNQILINLIDNAIKFSNRDDVINIIIRDSNEFDTNLNQTEIEEKKDMNCSNLYRIWYKQRRRMKKKKGTWYMLEYLILVRDIFKNNAKII